MRSLLLTILLCLYCCSGGGSVAGGSSSETTSGFTAISSAETVSGEALASSTVMLFSSEYNPLTNLGYADTITLDNESSYSFSTLSGGTYNLFAFDKNSQKRLFISSIKVDDSLRTYKAKYEAPGSVRGKIEFEDKTITDFPIALVGTPFVTTFSNESFTFEELPEGRYQITYQHKAGDWSTEEIVENKEITIVSDTTVEWTK